MGDDTVCIPGHGPDSALDWNSGIIRMFAAPDTGCADTTAPGGAMVRLTELGFCIPAASKIRSGDAGLVRQARLNG